MAVYAAGPRVNGRFRFQRSKPDLVFTLGIAVKTEDKITRLEQFRALLAAWQKSHAPDHRREINQTKAWIRREVIEAGCFKTLTISPPPAVGGLIMRNVDPFDMIFDPPYLMSMVPMITDMIDETIGKLQAGPQEPPDATAQIQVDAMRLSLCLSFREILNGMTFLMR